MRRQILKGSEGSAVLARILRGGKCISDRDQDPTNQSHGVGSEKRSWRIKIKNSMESLAFHG
jgi:hypothetical protein